MKKFIMIAMIAIAFVACNDNNDTPRETDTPRDSIYQPRIDSNVSHPADTNRVDPVLN